MWLVPTVRESASLDPENKMLNVNVEKSICVVMISFQVGVQEKSSVFLRQLEQLTYRQR